MKPLKCPVCGKFLKIVSIYQGGGVKCVGKRCTYWFCY